MFFKSIAFTCFLVGAPLAVATQMPVQTPKAEGKAFAFSLTGNGGYLGVETEEVSNENFGKYGLSGVRGVAVEKVVEGSPAEKAGLQSGDVIISVNDDEVTSTRKLMRMVGEIAPDHTARLTVFRGGTEREFKVTVGRRPTPGFGSVAFGRLAGMPDFPPSNAPMMEGLAREPREPRNPMVWAFERRRQIGIVTTMLTKQLAENFGVESGVMVSSVREGSPAARSGLKAGDIIVEANGKAVKSNGDLIRSIAEKKEGDVTITFVRGRGRQTVTVTPEEVKGGFNTYFEFPNAPAATPAREIYSVPRPAIPGVIMPMGRVVLPGPVI